MRNRFVRRPIRVLFLAAMTAAAASVIVPAAYGQTDVCTRLQAQLVAIERDTGGGDPRAFREYDQSVRQQKWEIDQATAAARRERCIGTFIFTRRNDSARCGELRATIDRMQMNLDRLALARDRYTTDPNARARQRRDILNELAANRCSSAGARVRSVPRSGGTLLDALFGTGRMRTYGEQEYFQGSAGGTYRTLCVRACDGYYFPISFSTVAGQFASDEQACRARCPAADVALYIHRNPGEEADQMVSLSGQPYTALPAAFRYRKEYDPSCGCGSVAAYPAQTGYPLQDAPANTLASLAPGFDTGGAFPAPASQVLPPAPQPFVPLPPRRPTRYEDPETLANRAGGLLFRRPVTASETARVGNLTADDGVRIVGPEVFFPEAMDNAALIPRGGRIFRRDREAGAAGGDGATPDARTGNL